MGLKDIIRKKVWSSTINEHPLLHEDIDVSTKEAYVAGMALAARLENETVSEQELNMVKQVGLSLKLTESTIQDTIATINDLKTDTEKADCLEGLIPSLKGRATALFFLGDFTKMYCARGKATQDMADVVNALAEWLELPKEDRTFFARYRAFLLPGKGPEAAQLLHDSQNSGLQLPNGFVRYFTPVLNRLILPGGNLPAGETRICDGSFRLDDTLKVGPNSYLVMHHADIEFGPQGVIELAETRADISNCTFSATPNGQNGAQQQPKMYFIESDANALTLTGCVLDGNMMRGSIRQADELTLKECEIRNCLLANEPIIACKQLFMFHTICHKLTSNKAPLIDMTTDPIQKCVVKECIFSQCYAGPYDLIVLHDESERSFNYMPDAQRTISHSLFCHDEARRLIHDSFHKIFKLDGNCFVQSDNL